jgi:hypothetical protein
MLLLDPGPKGSRPLREVEGTPGKTSGPSLTGAQERHQDGAKPELLKAELLNPEELNERYLSTDHLDQIQGCPELLIQGMTLGFPTEKVAGVHLDPSPTTTQASLLLQFVEVPSHRESRNLEK